MGRRGRVWGADRGSRSCCAAGEIVREEILSTDTPIFYRLYDVLHAGHWFRGLQHFWTASDAGAPSRNERRGRRPSLGVRRPVRAAEDPGASSLCITRRGDELRIRHMCIGSLEGLAKARASPGRRRRALTRECLYRTEILNDLAMHFT